MVSLHHMGLPKQYLEEVPTKNCCPNFWEGRFPKKISSQFPTIPIRGQGIRKLVFWVSKHCLCMDAQCLPRHGPFYKKKECFMPFQCKLSTKEQVLHILHCHFHFKMITGYCTDNCVPCPLTKTYCTLWDVNTVQVELYSEPCPKRFEQCKLSKLDCTLTKMNFTLQKETLNAIYCPLYNGHSPCTMSIICG